WTGAKLVIKRDGADHHGNGNGNGNGNGHGNGHGNGFGHFGWHSGAGKSPDHFEFQAGNGYSVDDNGALLKDGFLIGRLVESQGRLSVEFGSYGNINVSAYEGTATPTSADVNHVLQHIAYWNSSDDPDSSVTVQYRMEDGNGHWFGAQGKGGEKEGWD